MSTSLTDFFNVYKASFNNDHHLEWKLVTDNRDYASIGCGPFCHRLYEKRGRHTDLDAYHIKFVVVDDRIEVFMQTLRERKPPTVTLREICTMCFDSVGDYASTRGVMFVENKPLMTLHFLDEGKYYVNPLCYDPEIVTVENFIVDREMEPITQAQLDHN